MTPDACSPTLTINGIQKQLTGQSTGSLGELLVYLRQNLCTDSALISLIRVDGRELTEEDERALKQTPVAQLGPIEIFTSHPNEIAQETLQSLIGFSQALIQLSHATADGIRGSPVSSTELNRKYQALIDGLADFTEAVRSVKTVLKIQLDPDVNLLEADLLSVMEDVLKAQQSKDMKFLAELLDEHLPFNLGEWHARGLPKLIRARDS